MHLSLNNKLLAKHLRRIIRSDSVRWRRNRYWSIEPAEINDRIQRCCDVRGDHHRCNRWGDRLVQGSGIDVEIELEFGAMDV